MSRQIAGKEENVLSLGLKYFSCPLFTMKQNNKAKHIFFTGKIGASLLMGNWFMTHFPLE